MSRLLGDHTLGSAYRRFNGLVKGVGIGNTLSIIASVVDDQYLKCFDRKYNVRTSGYISLSETSFDRTRLADATRYRPVNAWAFRTLLRKLNLPKTLSFVDLGCGFGRACLLAAEYGFERVTGVELAPELCSVAEENLASSRLSVRNDRNIRILKGDAVEYCKAADDDIFFMFRPFSRQLLVIVVDALIDRAVKSKRPIIFIYSERLLLADSLADVFLSHGSLRKRLEFSSFGQLFLTFELALA
jgi:SAM-dependent methyltransferase